MLLPASLAVIVSASAAPETGVVVAAASTSCVAAPETTVTVLVVLVAVQLHHLAVTVYMYVPAARPESVQLVTAAGDPAVGQVPPASPPSRATE